MVPEGWDVKHLSELASKISDGIHKTPLYAERSDVHFINGNNLKNGSIVIQDSTKFVDENDAENHRKDLGERTLLMSINGTIGNLAYYRGENVVLGKSAAYINVRNSVDLDFIYYVLSSSKTQTFYESELTGTTIRNLSIKSIKSTKVDTPPLHEQKKIAQILSTWDKAITTTEQLLANSQQQKKAMMQQLLTGKQRLLDQNGERFEGEWKKVRLGTVADMNSGGTPKSNIEEYYGGTIPWVSIADMTKQGKWISSTEKNLTELGLENSSARIYPKNSVLYAMYASIGECSIAQVPLSSSKAILGIRPKSELNFKFLYFFLTSLKEKIKLQGQQGTQSNLNAGMVKDFVLYLPDMEEQQKIAAVLSTADQEITTLQQQLDHLKQEKKALMQQLLTGKRRVQIN